MQGRITRKRATYLLRRMYALLREEDFHFRFGKDLKVENSDAFAIADFETDDEGNLKADILIDPTTRIEGGIIALAFHELIHELYADLSEQETTTLEKQMIRLLSSRQLMNFLKRIVVLM